jgi:hypothetical protein
MQRARRRTPARVRRFSRPGCARGDELDHVAIAARSTEGRRIEQEYRAETSSQQLHLSDVIDHSLDDLACRRIVIDAIGQSQQA